MEQWLRKSQSINAVILVNIRESNKPNPKTLNGPARDRIRTLIEKFGTGECRDVHGNEFDTPDDDHSDDGNTTISPPGYYDEIEERVHAEDWVGYLIMTIEIWTKAGDSLVLRKRVVTTGQSQSPPYLLFSDFFETQHDRRMPLCVSEIGELLDIARKELAADRAICFLWSREREDL